MTTPQEGDHRRISWCGEVTALLSFYRNLGMVGRSYHLRNPRRSGFTPPMRGIGAPYTQNANLEPGVNLPIISPHFPKLIIGKFCTTTCIRDHSCQSNLIITYTCEAQFPKRHTLVCTCWLELTTMEQGLIGVCVLAKVIKAVAGYFPSKSRCRTRPP